MTLTVYQETCAMISNALRHKSLVQVVSSLVVSQISTVPLEISVTISNAFHHRSLDLVALPQDSARLMPIVTKMQVKFVMLASASCQLLLEEDLTFQDQEVA